MRPGRIGKGDLQGKTILLDWAGETETRTDTVMTVAGPKFLVIGGTDLTAVIEEGRLLCLK